MNMICLPAKEKGGYTKLLALHLLKWGAKTRRKNFQTADCKLLLHIEITCSDIPYRAICDSRTRFEIKKGYAIIFEFATPDIVVRWQKMKLPSSPELIKKVGDMEKDLVNRKVKMNFVFRIATGGTTA